jgi:hypothetical protein
MAVGLVMCAAVIARTPNDEYEPAPIGVG